MSETESATPEGARDFSAPASEETSEARVENPVIAQIAAEHADPSRTVAIENRKLAEQAEAAGDTRSAELYRLESELAERDAKLSESFWSRVTEVAIRKGDPLPLTNAESERMWELGHKVGEKMTEDERKGPWRKTFEELLGRRDPEVEELLSLTERNVLFRPGGLIFGLENPEYFQLQKEVEKENGKAKLELTAKIEVLKRARG